VFEREPQRLDDWETFSAQLVREYFGEGVDLIRIRRAWNLFCEAWLLYPFSHAMLYYAPMNYAPAFPLSPDYRGAPMTWTWEVHEWGDRVEDCLGGLPLEEVAAAYEEMRELWARGVPEYIAALQGANLNQSHVADELACARMIGTHLRSMANIMRFHAWRLAAMRKAGLSAPCHVALDAPARAILKDELANARHALELLETDPRLGFHEDCQARLCDPAKVREKIAAIEVSLRG
jgi:hypothetical protein